MNGYKVVVTKSTVPTGTGRMIEQILKEKNGRHDFSVVSNPEFLREGSAVADFLRPDRVVIGAGDARAVEVLKEIYSPLYLIETPFVITDVASAELIKYASNGFLAVKISFINEVARLCELMGADVHDVAKGMGLDQRIGSKFLHPGPGLRRLLLSEGHVRGGGPRAPARLHVPDHRGDDAGQRRDEGAHDRKDRRRRRARSRARPPPCSASPSSPRPTTSASRRPWPWSPTCSRRAPRSAPSIRRRCRRHEGRPPGPPLRGATPTTAPTGADFLVLATEWNAFRALDLRAPGGRSCARRP